MTYNLKKIKEKELSSFLLNPFERTAYFENVIIQKFERCHEVDDFMCINVENCSFVKNGFIVYEKEQIILTSDKMLDTDVISYAPFVDIETLRNNIKQTIISKIKEAKDDKLDEIKKMQTYIDAKKTLSRKYFHYKILTKIGKKCIKSEIKSKTYEKVSKFVNNLSDKRLSSIILGSNYDIDEFIEELITSSDFIESDVVQPEVADTMNEYIKAGKFTEQEKLFIRYLESKQKDE